MSGPSSETTQSAPCCLQKKVNLIPIHLFFFQNIATNPNETLGYAPLCFRNDIRLLGDTVTQLFEALRFKPEDRGFEFRIFH